MRQGHESQDRFDNVVQFLLLCVVLERDEKQNKIVVRKTSLFLSLFTLKLLLRRSIKEL